MPWEAQVLCHLIHWHSDDLLDFCKNVEFLHVHRISINSSGVSESGGCVRIHLSSVKLQFLL